MKLPGKRIAFVGMGGGSDCIQAAILAKLSPEPACVVSVRAGIISSQGNSGAIGEKRRIMDHGGEISLGVFVVTAQTSGSGRFLEALPAHALPVYLVMDCQDGTLSEQIQSAVDHFGDVDTVIGVDTGGDCLYRTSVDDMTKATPDQDIASLKAIAQIRDKARFSCVIANGVDAPDYAAEVLKAAQANAFSFSPEEKTYILDLYKEFKMDGTHPDFFGKTPYAWQAALRGERGEVKLPLPDKVVNDKNNPWNPYVVITDEMENGYCMTVENHLQAIGLKL